MNVIIAGARRSGTTSLYNYLGQHPKIGLARQGAKREVHFYDRFCDNGVAWYKQQFVSAKHTLDKSPTYFQVPDVPKRIKRTFPNSRIIISLRHPVDRAYSDFAKRRKEGYEKRRWPKAVNAEMIENYSSDPYWMSQLHLFGYLARSDYGPQLERWFDTFDAKQIMVIQYEFWIANIQKVMNEVFWFLGLEPVRVKTEKRWQAMRYVSMKPVMRAKLDAYFKVRSVEIPFAVGRDDWHY